MLFYHCSLLVGCIMSLMLLRKASRLLKEQQDAWQQALALLHLSAIFGDLSNHQPFINEIKIAFANIKNKGIKATISQLLSDEQK